MKHNEIDNENIGLRPLIVDYLRHWKLIAVSGVIALIVAVAYLVLYPRTYEAMARVMIQDDRGMLASGSVALGEAAGMMKSFGLGGIGGSAAINIDNEISTFYTNQLIREAVTELQLYTEYTPIFPAWHTMYGEEPIKVLCDSLSISKLTDGIKFRVKVDSDHKIRIKTTVGKKVVRTDSFDSFPAIVELKEGRFTFVRNQQQPSNESFSLCINVSPPGWVAEDLADLINIEDYSNTADIIEFTCPDHQKQRAVDILNKLIELYNRRAFDYKYNLAGASQMFLDKRIRSVMEELNQIEQKIEAYKIANRITDVTYDIQFYGEFLKELNMKIIEAETQANMVNLLDQFVKNPENRYKLVPTLLSSGQESTEGSPLFLYNQALLERERILKNNATASSPAVQNIEQQVSHLRESVFRTIENARQSIAITQQDLKNRESQLMGRMSNVPGYERTYVDYKRQQEILQGVYLILLQKREDIALSVGLEVEKAKVIDAAFVKKRPIAPRKLYAAIIVVALTLLISIGWLFVSSQVAVIWKLLRKQPEPSADVNPS